MSELKYKVGDRVKYDSEICTVTKVIESQGKFKYRVQSDTWFDVVEDEMIERLVEEETKPKFKVGDKVILDPYPCVVTDVNWKDSLHGFVYTVRGTDFGMKVGEEDLIFDTSEEETPKFKINDIVFVKSIGWVRITNGYWDSFANEYIYEAIGSDGEGEYDCISQSHIECQMLPESESENPHTGGNKITLEEYKNNDKEWLFNKLAILDNITALESIQDIFNHLQQPKYPKSYEECCEILGCIAGYVWGGYKGDLIKTFHMLYICREAYWKLYGEEIGLNKPWEPDWYDDDTVKYCIIVDCGIISKQNFRNYQFILAFPTEEMRDAFYENFKKEIEMCKELL